MQKCIYYLFAKKDYKIIEKNEWLDKYAPFFKENNRVIISKENKNSSSIELKINFLKNLEHDEFKTIIVIDDDNSILKGIKNEIKEIVLFQDSSLVD